MAAARGGEGGDSGPQLMFNLLVSICQRDFEFWWKHHRRTEHKDDRELSYPLLYYLLDSRRNLVDNLAATVFKLYELQLTAAEDEDMSDTRKLIGMAAMLIAHLDLQERHLLVSAPPSKGGLKHQMATRLRGIFARSSSSLNSDGLYIEMNLLKPSWLAQLVAQQYLDQEKGLPVKCVRDVTTSHRAALSTTCDTHLLAGMDTLLAKMLSTRDGNL